MAGAFVSASAVVVGVTAAANIMHMATVALSHFSWSQPPADRAPAQLHGPLAAWQPAWERADAYLTDKSTAEWQHLLATVQCPEDELYCIVKRWFLHAWHLGAAMLKDGTAEAALLVSTAPEWGPEAWVACVTPVVRFARQQAALLRQQAGLLQSGEGRAELQATAALRVGEAKELSFHLLSFGQCTYPHLLATLRGRQSNKLSSSKPTLGALTAAAADCWWEHLGHYLQQYQEEVPLLEEPPEGEVMPLLEEPPEEEEMPLLEEPPEVGHAAADAVRAALGEPPASEPHSLEEAEQPGEPREESGGDASAAGEGPGLSERSEQEAAGPATDEQPQKPPEELEPVSNGASAGAQGSEGQVPGPSSLTDGVGAEQQQQQPVGEAQLAEQLPEEAAKQARAQQAGPAATGSAAAESELPSAEAQVSQSGKATCFIVGHLIGSVDVCVGYHTTHKASQATRCSLFSSLTPGAG